MKRINLMMIAIMATTVLFTSCKEDIDNLDTEKPVIVLNSPTEGDAFQTGQTVDVDVTFSDDQLLKSYSITAAPTVTGGSLPIGTWDEEFTGDLTSALQNVQESLLIPDNVSAGAYTLTFNATDDKDKNADETVVEINIQNASDLVDPVINVTEPDLSVTLTLDAGAAYSVAGVVSDNVELWQVKVETVQEDNIISTETFDATGSTFDLAENLGAPVDAGTYTLRITAIDKVNNISVTEGLIVVQ